MRRSTGSALEQSVGLIDKSPGQNGITVLIEYKKYPIIGFHNPIFHRGKKTKMVIVFSQSSFITGKIVSAPPTETIPVQDFSCRTHDKCAGIIISCDAV